MLTAAQVEVRAYREPTAGELLCRDCAVKSTSSMDVELADVGHSHSALVGVIEYHLGEEETSLAEQAVESQEQDRGQSARTSKQLVLDATSEQWREPTEAEDADLRTSTVWGYEFADGSFLPQEDPLLSPTVTCTDCGAALL